MKFTCSLHNHNMTMKIDSTGLQGENPLVVIKSKNGARDFFSFSQCSMTEKKLYAKKMQIGKNGLQKVRL